MSVSATIGMQSRITETIESGIEFASSPSVVHTPGTNVSINATSTPDGEKFSGAEYALTAGSGSIDFTALTGIVVAVDGTGLRPRWVYFCNTGAANITIAKGASNGIDMFGASWTITLRPGEQISRTLSTSGPAVVSGTNKIIDLTGTGTDTLQMAVILG